MKISVIISTYNAPLWLEKVLWGYSVQTEKNFEILIADDGSDEITQNLIELFNSTVFNQSIIHVWHEDKGYRRQEILNKAILLSTGDYIIMTDGDCIPRKDFVEIHAKHAKKGYFLSGGYCKLSMKLSSLIDKNAILNENCFDLNWLKKHDKIGFSQSLKIKSNGFTEILLDKLTPTGATFNNCNSSAWKKDILEINGYDERMKYGGPDRELGERLNNIGIKGIQIRHKAICLHLEHKRSYKTKESLTNNLTIRKQTKKEKVKKTLYGIEKFTFGV